MTKLRVRQEAIFDIKVARAWFESKSPGLGKRFVEEVRHYLIYIRQNPSHYQIKNADYREAVLKVFPYVIIYTTSQQETVVFAVFPTAKSPHHKPR